MGKRKLSQTAHNVNPAQKRWKKDFDHKKAKGKKGAAPAVHAKGQQQQKPRQLPTAFQKKKEKEALKFESESDEDEELTGEEMEDESESDEGEVLPQTKAINKKGAAPAVQAKAQQPQKKGQLVTAVQTKKAKETLKFETESDEDEELTDEEMEDESDSDEGEVLPQTKANNKKSAAPAMQAKAQQPQKKGQLVTAVQTKKTKETLKFESESDEDEELTDEEMEDESDSDEGEVLPQTKAKDKKVAPVVAKAQQPQNQLATAVQKKKEKEALKFESESDEDEELTDEEMEDEDESDEGEVLQQTKDKKGAAPVVQAKAQQQQKQRDAAAATNGSAKKEGLSHQSAKFKAIVAEEDRRRAERDKVTIFLRCEALQKMTEHEIKSLHPDTLSVRTNNKGYCWLLFASEPTAEKALAALSKKTAISGKELYVDRCGAKAQSKSEKLKKGKALDQPINPTELIISNFPLATTTEQLKVIFPTAKSVRLVTLNAKKNNFRRATRALIDFGNEADAKKAFDKGAQIKVGGAPVDLYFARV